MATFALTEHPEKWSVGTAAWLQNASRTKVLSGGALLRRNG